MRKIIVYAIVIGASFITVACGNKKSEAIANANEWPEMDEFHMVMAESFHPYKDSANLEPAKANAAEMVKVAEKWLRAPLPEKVNTDEVKADLAKLKDETASFVEIVQRDDSIKIGESLTALHDQFHKLQEAWYGQRKGGDRGH